MATMIVRIKVKEYGAWRSVFDGNQSLRDAAGLTNSRVYRSADDGNEIMIVYDVSDMKKAKEFATSPSRKGDAEGWRCRHSD